MENPPLLSLISGVTFVCIVLEIFGLAYTLDHGTLFSKITPWLEERFRNLVHQSDYDARSARILRIIQEDLGCCGATGWSEYFDHNKPVPNECRDKNAGNMYVYGCGFIFSQYLEPRTGWLSGIALLLVCLQILAVIAKLVLSWAVKRDARQQGGKSYNAVSTSKI